MSTAAPLQYLTGQSKSSSASTKAGFPFQRKSAFGPQTSSLLGERAECQGKLRLQTKLKIGASNDPLEQVADRVAHRMLTTRENYVAGATPRRVQVETVQASDGAADAPPSVECILANSGCPLESELREDMEQRFAHDFSSVRVHSDGAAEQSVRDVDATAYTVGNHIVFGKGWFTPTTHEGRWLIAHELTHVVQQSGPKGIYPSQSAVSLPSIFPVRSVADEVLAGSTRPAAMKPRLGHNFSRVQVDSGNRYVLQRQPAVAKPATRPDSVPGLGPVRTEEVENLINAKEFQDALDTLVGYKYMDYEIDTSLLKNRRMLYDPSLKSSNATTAMGGWDYLSTPPKAEPANVKVGPSAFSGVPYLYSVIMHEYQHVLWQQALPNQKLSNLLHGQGFETPDEVEAGAWELLHASETGVSRLPSDVAQIWANLNEAFWKLDAQSQTSERQLVVRAFQKAKTLTKGSQVSLDTFSPP